MNVVPSSLQSLTKAEPLLLPEPTPAAKATGAKKAKTAPMYKSFKEMWNVTHARLSLDQSNLYESGGSGFWLSFNPRDNLAGTDATDQQANALFPVHLGSWSQLLQAKALFVESPHYKNRIVFPVQMDCACRSVNDVCQNAYPESLKLLGNHLILAAWWACAHDALIENDDARLGKLYEAMQTITVRVTLWESNTHVMKIALESAERARGLAVVADNVVLFSDRLSVIVQDVEGGTNKQLEYVKNAKVMHQSKPISRNLLVGGLAISKNLTARSRSIVSYLESRYGRKLITESTTKLYRMMNLAKKHANGPAFAVKLDVCDAMELLLSQLAVALDSSQLQPDDCIGSFLTGEEGSGGKEDQACWARTALQAIALGQHARALVGRMERSLCPSSFCGIIETLTNPLLWRQELLKYQQACRDTLPRES